MGHGIPESLRVSMKSLKDADACMRVAFAEIERTVDAMVENRRRLSELLFKMRGANGSRDD